MGLLSDWLAWKETLPSITKNDGDTVIPSPEELTHRIVNIQGQIINGWVTFDIGAFGPDDSYYPRLTRSCSLRIPENLQVAAYKLLNGAPSDEEILSLLGYAQSTPEYIGNCCIG